MNKPMGLALAASLLIPIACGNDLHPASEITGVRVLAVKVDTPYARPGTTAQLDMLLVDGAAARPNRSVNIVWLHGCVNPAGDLYYGCYPDLARRLGEAYGGARTPLVADIPGLVAHGTHTTVDLPADTLTRHAPPPPGQVLAGRAYAFFAACAGSVIFDPQTASSSGVPIRCTDPASGADLGAEDFVFGYTPVFVFDQLANASPIINDVLFDGAPVSHATCDQGCPARYACGSRNRCLPVVASCNAGSADDCPGRGFQPIVDRASAENDPVASAFDSRPSTEQVYVSYTATNGRFDSNSSSRIINDPSNGWTDDYAGQFVAYHSQPGPVSLYAIVRDNRGGQTWTTIDLLVQ